MEEMKTTGDLASALGIAIPNAQIVVDDAAARGLITLHKAGRVRLFTPADMQKMIDERDANVSVKNEFGKGWPKGKPRKVRVTE